VDLTALLEKTATGEEINEALRAGAAGPLKGILAVEDAPPVSIDYRRNSNSSIVDSQFTKVVDGNLAKVLAWYDNEWGYSCRVRDLIKYIAKQGLCNRPSPVVRGCHNLHAYGDKQTTTDHI